MNGSASSAAVSAQGVATGVHAAADALPDARGDAHRPADGRCRNCGALAPSRFCPDCGQTTAIHPPTVREFVHEFVTHSVALEGALWRTLVALLFRPGRLTVDYFDGRRARYIAPLRLYLTFSLVFFAITNVGSGDINFLNQDFKFSTKPARDVDVVEVRPVTMKLVTGIGAIDRALDRGRAMSHEEATAHLRAGIRAYLPYVLILMVPMLAVLFRLAYWNRHWRYGRHLVVAFHAQTAALIFGLVSAIPLGDAYGAVIFVLFFVQGMRALQRVYGGRLLPTVLRETTLLTVYAFMLLMAVSTLAVLSIFLS